MRLIQPSEDQKFATFLQQFVTVASDNLSTLGLTAADTAAIADARTDLESKIIQGVTLRAAAAGAVTARKTSRRSADALLRQTQRKIIAMPNVPPALLQQVGINAHSAPGPNVTPKTPGQFYALADVSGINTLRWKAEGNKQQTMYIIEARVGDAPDFAMVDSTMSTTYKHMGQTVGVEVTYRVRAQRGKRRSNWSNESVVYKAAPAAPVVPAAASAAPPLTLLRAA